MENKISKKTHLTFADRNRLQRGLANKKSFKEIGLELHKSPSTISREIKAHMFIKKKGRKFSRYFNDCIYRKVCNMRLLTSRNFENLRYDMHPLKFTLYGGISQTISFQNWLHFLTQNILPRTLCRLD